MPDTIISTTDVAAARAVVRDALKAHAENERIAPADAALANSMADNVRGWTHTTRLRDFLKGASA